MSDEKRLTAEQRIAHFRRLVAIAYADEKLADPELAVLRGVAGRWGIEPREVNAALETPDAEAGSWPDDPLIRARMMYDFVELSVIDGELAASERRLLNGLESELAVAPGAVDRIKDAILEGNRLGRHEDDIRNEVCARIAG